MDPSKKNPKPMKFGSKGCIALTAAILTASLGLQAQNQSATPLSGQHKGENTPFEPDYVAEQAEYNVVVERVDAERSQVLGTIRLQGTAEGLRIMPKLKGLSPGQHGFTLNRNAKCSPSAGPGDGRAPAHDAGPVFNPIERGERHGRHPEGKALGVLPPLEVGEDGRAVTAATAPWLQLQEVAGRSLVIYEEPDAPVEGAEQEPNQDGQRIACGIIRR